MGIDRIGKGGGLPPTQGAGDVGGAERTGRTFQVEGGAKAQSKAPVDAAQAAGPSLLEQLRAGQIDAATYMDKKVDEATSGLRGLSSSELDSIKSVLRSQMATDPQLRDLFQQATGQHPPAPPEDEG
ncbi:MAG: hypothetical protein JNL38_10055 [Myxococcales bacterium]|jgi:hypothetical protein|nr:hypothetical protein [Myxococcales bacterium]